MIAWIHNGRPGAALTSRQPIVKSLMPVSMHELNNHDDSSDMEGFARGREADQLSVKRTIGCMHDARTHSAERRERLHVVTGPTLHRWIVRRDLIRLLVKRTSNQSERRG